MIPYNALEKRYKEISRKTSRKTLRRTSKKEDLSTIRSDSASYTSMVEDLLRYLIATPHAPRVELTAPAGW
ncbi:hypothetical protein ACN38_g8129 [Penicillium nordicum]|uniref:Uncharacterized protein n=1 Tax=Penicillium nordicum TaxID=229535 RepID=A0A0M8P485_9EURO|nr:hypothetical protein ACN38_g8129 [Penicillium nordicum]